MGEWAWSVNYIEPSARLKYEKQSSSLDGLKPVLPKSTETVTHF